jgi:hypothetical protein
VIKELFPTFSCKSRVFQSLVVSSKLGEGHKCQQHIRICTVEQTTCFLKERDVAMRGLHVATRLTPSGSLRGKDTLPVSMGMPLSRLELIHSCK